MSRALAALIALAVTLGGGGGRALAAQAPPPPRSPAPPPDTVPPTLTLTLNSNVPQVATAGLLSDGVFVSLMASGFPLRLHYRLELWRRRANWFDQFASDFAWDVLVQQDPLSGDYVVTRSVGGPTRHRTAQDLARALAIPYRVTLAPRTAGRFYYVATLEAETLSASDIDEVMRWLKGDLSPAVQGERGFGEALSQGAQRLLVRLAGLPRLHLEARSGTIERR